MVCGEIVTPDRTWFLADGGADRRHHLGDRRGRTRLFVRRGPRAREPLRGRARGAGRGPVAARGAAARVTQRPHHGVRLRLPAHPVPLRRGDTRDLELARARLRRAEHSRDAGLEAGGRDRDLDAQYPGRLRFAGAPVAAVSRASRSEAGLTLTEVMVVMIIGTMIMAGLVGFYLASQ